MRIRQVKPEFWRDEKIADLPPVSRLTYIGLWMLADDAGWFRLDIPAIAMELYGWEPRRQRERVVGAAVERLTAIGRIAPEAECIHASIPTFTVHQRFSVESKRVFTFRKEHEAHLPAGIPQTPAGGRDIPTRYVKGIGTGTGNVTEGFVSESYAPARAPSGAAGAVDWASKVAETQERGRRAS